MNKWAAPALASAATLVLFLPCVRFAFLNWDDQPFLVNNPFFRGLSWTHLRWMFTTCLAGPYQPLSWLSYALDHAVWGMNPAGFHLTNVVLHAANAALFCALAKRLLEAALAAPGEDGPEISLAAGMAALLFAAHPLRAESVAWVTERRDVLSGFFYLLTLLLYLSGRKRASLAAYGCSLLAKGIGVSLPVTLLALDFYPLRRRLDSAVLREKLPYLALAVAAGGVGFWAQGRAGALVPIDAEWSSRAAHAAYAFVFYPWKSLVPTGLTPFYALPLTRPAWHWSFVLSGAAVLAATAAAVLGRRRWPAATAAWFHYLAAAAPIVGLVRFGPQLAADRYSYLSCLAWPLLCAGGFVHLWRGALRQRRAPLAAGALGLILLSAAGTARQTAFWRDSLSLWTRAVSIDPDLPLARNNLGEALAASGRPEEAIEQYRRAIELDASYADARNNLAVVQDERGETDAALAQFWTALWLKPGSKEAFTNLGLAYAARGDRDRAVFLLGKVIELDPTDARARSRLASVQR